MRPPNSKNTGLSKAFLQQAPHNVGYSGLFGLVDFLGFFVQGHAGFSMPNFYQIFQVFLI